MNPVEPIRDVGKLLEIKRRLKRENARNYLLFTLGINTALRIGDLLPLRVDDVLNDEGNVKEFVSLREKKTGKDKRIKLNDAATEAIEFYLSSVKPKSTDWLFPSRRTGKPITRIQAYRLITQWAREVGIRDRIGTHSLRKTWGYQARKSGVPLELIQAKLGHSSPGVTRRYIGITADEIENVENHVNL